EPYFTTKDQGEGTGLGLAVVHGIVKEYNGAIKVYSEVGKGTELCILFPLIQRHEEADQTESAAPPPMGTETILLVDDEEDVVNAGKQTLERLGYNVVSVTSGAEALDNLKLAKSSYDLVITDKTMPKMTGFDLAVEIKKIKPEIPILLWTGFQEKNIKDRIQKSGIEDFVMKPINKREIADAIRKVLDKQNS
ncbi:response regulator, partial [Thermodesulfobacteriota bacterium]